MIDYEKLAESIEETREALRAMVAGLVDDGFTDEQARQIVVAIMIHEPEESDE